MGLMLLGAVAGCTPYVGEPPALIGTGESAGTIHRVARGETLWAISQRYGVSLEQLARANGISDRSQIETGQRLKIPSSGAALPPRPAPAEMVTPRASAQRLPGDSGKFAWPVQGRVISIFGTRRRGTINKGIDIQARDGAEVVASRSGRVSFVHESLPGFGKTVILEHADGFASVYAHLGEILIQQGEPVAQYQRIGRTQVSALHFQVRRQQKPQNPLHYLP